MLSKSTLRSAKGDRNQRAIPSIQELHYSKMLKPFSLFGHKKTSNNLFKDFYGEWIETLENTLLPLLRRSMSLSSPSVNLLATQVDMIHHHFQVYYDALDLAASDDDVAQLLFPEWRNSLEKPFLWLGDLHPYLFTNLLRSFLEDDDEEEEEHVGIGEVSELFDKPFDVVMAWKEPGKDLMARIEQIECGLRLMVPALVARARTAQRGFVERVAAAWGLCGGKKEAAKAAIGEAFEAQMVEMRGVLVDANRLRRSVLADIINAASVHQAALFLEGLAQFVVGFRNRQFLRQFRKCRMPLDL